MSETLLEAIRNRVLLGDGAMGTQLQYAGLEPGGCGEAWNIECPDRVLKIQREYVDAGSDCLITNTFGGSRIMLDRHDRGDDVRAINEAGLYHYLEKPWDNEALKIIIRNGVERSALFIDLQARIADLEEANAELDGFRERLIHAFL